MTTSNSTDPAHSEGADIAAEGSGWTSTFYAAPGDLVGFPATRPGVDFGEDGTRYEFTWKRQDAFPLTTVSEGDPMYAVLSHNCGTDEDSDPHARGVCEQVIALHCVEFLFCLTKVRDDQGSISGYTIRAVYGRDI